MTNSAQAYNFGPNSSDALPVLDMLNLTIDAWGSGNFIIKNEERQPHEAGLLTLDVCKAKAHLNWNPKMNASKAVSFTVKWYKEFNTNFIKY